MLKQPLLVVEAYRLGKHDNVYLFLGLIPIFVVEAYRLGKHDNLFQTAVTRPLKL